MTNKPDKFGFKLCMAVDVNTKYFLNGFMYLGKDEERDKSLQLSEYVIMKLMDPFLSEVRNVNTEFFFTPKHLQTHY